MDKYTRTHDRFCNWKTTTYADGSRQTRMWGECICDALEKARTDERSIERGEAHDRVLRHCMDARHDVIESKGLRTAIQPCINCSQIAAVAGGRGAQ